MKYSLVTPFLLIPLVSTAQLQATGGPGATATPPGAVPAPAAHALPKLYDSKIAQVSDLLQLTDQQESLWADYVAQIDACSKAYYQEKPASVYLKDPAPRQIGRFIDTLQNRLAMLDGIERSAKALYSALSPEQQAVADQHLFSTVPVFASNPNPAMAPAAEGKSRGDRPNEGQRKRRGPGMGG